ncbi:MAG: hypothetical protein K2Z81_24860 [Cyanobacteria bacterium]|nr:hypothetical protein [Cyanobacteriota bacterium]
MGKRPLISAMAHSFVISTLLNVNPADTISLLAALNIFIVETQWVLTTESEFRSAILGMGDITIITTEQEKKHEK